MIKSNEWKFDKKSSDSKSYDISILKIPYKLTEILYLEFVPIYFVNCCCCWRNEIHTEFNLIFISIRNQYTWEIVDIIRNSCNTKKYIFIEWDTNARGYEQNISSASVYRNATNLTSFSPYRKLGTTNFTCIILAVLCAPAQFQIRCSIDSIVFIGRKGIQ